MTVYLDHAATTPLRPEARDAWLAATELVGNASSVHGAGQAARRALEDARERIAAALGCEAIEVVLTSGGTESINLALKGMWWSRSADVDAIVLPDGEHHATMEAATWLAAHENAQIRHVALAPNGAVLPADFAEALPGAAAATAVVANNEVGTVNDVAELAGAAAEAGTPLHLDAVGAVGTLDVSFARLRGAAAGPVGLVALSMSGHKVGAPVGTGALVVSRHARIAPLIHGGGQQRGLRAGTQDLPGAAALAAALDSAVAARDAETTRLTALRERLIAGIHRALPAVRLLGDPVRRLPGNVHLLLPGVVGESMLFLLDQQGIAASTGSACQAGVAEPSHVVRALGYDERAARSVLRLTLGHTTTADDVDAVLAALPAAYARAGAPAVR